MTIDVWAQITTERMAKRPWLEPLLRWTGRTGEALVPSVATTLQSMDAAGVEIALLSAWYGPEGDLIPNLRQPGFSRPVNVAHPFCRVGLNVHHRLPA